MDSKPIAIIIGVVITIGVMGVIIIFGGNALIGASTNTELSPKSLDVISIAKDSLAVNVLLINRGSSTIDNVSAVLEIDGKYDYPLKSNDNVSPHGTLVITGNIQGPATLTNLLSAYNGIGVADADAKIVTGIWDIYAGDEVLLHLEGETTSGDIFEKIYEITVK